MHAASSMSDDRPDYLSVSKGNVCEQRTLFRESTFSGHIYVSIMNCLEWEFLQAKHKDTDVDIKWRLGACLH